jgi:hypothetical protein
MRPPFLSRSTPPAAGTAPTERIMSPGASLYTKSPTTGPRFYAGHRRLLHQRGARQTQDLEKPRKSHGFLKACVWSWPVPSSVRVSYGVVNFKAKDLNSAPLPITDSTTVVLNSPPRRLHGHGGRRPRKDHSANGSL